MLTQAPRPFLQCTHIKAAARAIVSALCVFVCLSWTPPVSLRHVRNAVGDVGDERKERGRKGQEDSIFRSRQIRATWLVCLCQCSLPAVHLKQEGHLLVHCSLAKLLSLSPQAVGCDIIGLGGRKSL